MAIDGRPWFIGAEGVLHSAEVARQNTYSACGGNSGVGGVNDLKIVQLNTPGAGVQVLPGGVTMVNNYPGGSGQAYTGRVASATTIPIVATPSGSGRSDLIIARIYDPQYGDSAGFNPADPNAFNFFRVEVIQGVSASTRYLTAAYPGYALARIDIPANTGTITNAMITDLREKGTPNSKIISRVVAPAGDMNANAAGYANWPSGTAPTVLVPTWATKLTLITHLSGVEVTGPSVTCGIRGVVGTVIDNNNGIISKTAAGMNRESYTHISEFNIPSDYRGTTRAFALQAYKSSAGGSVQLDYQSTIGYLMHFEEVAE